MTMEKLNRNSVAFMVNAIASIAEKTENFCYRCGRTRRGFVEYLKSVEIEKFEPESMVKTYIGYACEEIQHEYELNAIRAKRRREENERAAASLYGED